MTNLIPKLRLPAEFEKHAATWMIWPYRLDTWHDNAIPARIAYADIANAISKFEKVNMIIRPEDMKYAKTLLKDSIRFFNIPFDSEWTRDTGPLIVKDGNGNKIGIDFKFDSWGEIYHDYELDDKLAIEITKSLRLPLLQNKLILEGGQILVDGKGTLITTEECFFKNKRKSIYTKKKLENIFRRYFGVKKTIWLKRGMYKDIVNGHIDNLCGFAKPQLIALAWTDDKSDPQYEISKEAYDILSSSTDAKGRAFQIVKIHQPDPLFIKENEGQVIGDSFYKIGDRLCASYINFYIVNNGLIIPKFDDIKYDNLAREKLRTLFRNRKCIQISSREIILGGGGIHCITMQEPI